MFAVFKMFLLGVTCLPHLSFKSVMVLFVWNKFCCILEFGRSFFVFYEFGSPSNHCSF